MYLQSKLRGREFLNILQHLETCTECYHLLPNENPVRVVNTLLADSDEDGDSLEEK
jgi:hypothetical protein